MSKKFCDRKDGKRVKNISGMQYILCDLKPNRCDSDVYINEKIDVTELLKYIEKKNKNKEGKKYTVFHAFSQAIAMTIYNRPLLNRFIANKKFYDRNEVKLSFVAKVNFEDTAKEMLIVLNVKEEYTIDDFNEQIVRKVSKVREKNEVSDTNNLIDIIGSLPKIIRVPIIGIVKILDSHGWLPKSMTNDNIYYSTVIMSNLGSIKCGAIYHNLTNFGTNSILATMGEIHKENVFIDGKEQVRDICEFGVNLDERIADGVYFAKSVNLLKYILSNPKLLDKPANTKVEIEKNKK